MDSKRQCTQRRRIHLACELKRHLGYYSLERQLTETTNNWQTQIKELQALLDELRPRLIDAEAQLAEKIAAISAFEFKLRAQIGPLVDRLEKLQGEIRALRQQLRHMQEDWFFAQDIEDSIEWDTTDWQFDATSGAAAEGRYRYMGPQVQPPAGELSKDTREAIKKIYRQLARRFHPDLALNEEDRAYRTDMMMRINAAYTAGDLEQLQAIATEPDSVSHLDAAQTDQQLAEALMREVARCQRRLSEIGEEMARLARHRNARLQEKAEQLVQKGRDYLQELMVELQEQIAQAMVERDVLQQEIETFGEEIPDFASDMFADTMFNLNLEQVFEADPDLEAEDWHRRYSKESGYENDEDILDNLDY